MHRGNRSCFWCGAGLYWVPRTWGSFGDNVLMRERWPKPLVEPPEPVSLLTELWDWTKINTKHQQRAGDLKVSLKWHQGACVLFTTASAAIFINGKNQIWQWIIAAEKPFVLELSVYWFTAVVNWMAGIQHIITESKPDPSKKRLYKKRSFGNTWKEQNSDSWQ